MCFLECVNHSLQYKHFIRAQKLIIVKIVNYKKSNNSSNLKRSKVLKVDVKGTKLHCTRINNSFETVYDWFCF